ncbi:MAG: carboxypeptidase-like regulatory domain-containing protein [Bacteroidia bacterium]
MKKTLVLFLFNIFIIAFSATYAYADGVQISGKLTDKYTGEGISGVYVQVKETETGTYTDAKGNFQVELPSGNYHLQFSLYSYQALEVSLDANKSKAVTYNLKPVEHQNAVQVLAHQEKPQRESAITRFLSLLEYVFLHKLWQ